MTLNFINPVQIFPLLKDHPVEGNKKESDAAWGRIYTKSNNHGNLFFRLMACEQTLSRKEEGERHVSRGKYTDSTREGT